MRRITYTIIVLMLGLMACDISNPVSISRSHFIYVTRDRGMTSYGRPKLTITIRNAGSRSGYNVACWIQAKRGNTIVDSGLAYFADGTDIEPGDMAVDTAIFFDLTTFDGIKLKYDLTWLER